MMKFRNRASHKVPLAASIVLAAILLFIIKPARSTAPPFEPENTPQKIIACIPPDFKPTYFQDEKGQAAGFILIC